MRLVDRQFGHVVKGWGKEFIWVSTDDYCAKDLIFDKIGAKCSMHFHKDKHETWRVISGSFAVTYIDTSTAKKETVFLNPGDIWTNTPLVPHSITCLEPGTIQEVSTPDSISDNYRVLPGDSQNVGNS